MQITLSDTLHENQPLDDNNSSLGAKCDQYEKLRRRINLFK